MSSFILPSVVRRGKLVITVSTGGASPSAARKIAKEIDKTYGDEYEIYLDFLSETRLMIQNHVKDKEARQRLFKEMLAWDLIRLIREGTFEDWKQKFNIALHGAAWMQSQEQERMSCLLGHSSTRLKYKEYMFHDIQCLYFWINTLTSPRRTV